MAASVSEVFDVARCSIGEVPAHGGLSGFRVMQLAEPVMAFLFRKPGRPITDECRCARCRILHHTFVEPGDILQDAVRRLTDAPGEPGRNLRLRVNIQRGDDTERKGVREQIHHTYIEPPGNRLEW